MPSLIRFVLLSLSLCCLPVLAAPVPGLYQVREPVTDQQPGTRDQALQRAVAVLVQRLTGGAANAKNAALDALQADPQQIITQYNYVGDNLLVDFDAVSTDRFLRNAGMTIWGVNRPEVLVWWLAETTEGSRLVGESQGNAALLQQAGQYRGLPLRLPLADLSEQLVVTDEVLAASEPALLNEASARYESDALLAVRAGEQAGSWQANWQLWVGAEHKRGSAQAATQAELADAVMLAVNQYLAARFIVKPGSAQEMTLVIEGANLANLVLLERLLEPFAATLQSIEGNTLVYQVRASTEQLQGQLALAHLRPVTQNAEPAGVEATELAVPVANTLRFSW